MFILTNNDTITLSLVNSLQKIIDSPSIRNKNLQVLPVEIFKIKNDVAPQIMKDLLIFREPSYTLLSEGSSFVKRKSKTTYGISQLFI